MVSLTMDIEEKKEAKHDSSASGYRQPNGYELPYSGGFCIADAHVVSATTCKQVGLQCDRRYGYLGLIIDLFCHSFVLRFNHLTI